MSDEMNAIMEIYPWLLEISNEPGNIRLSEFGRKAASAWIMDAKCPTFKLALAVDAMSSSPTLAKIVAQSYGITVNEDVDAEAVRKRIVKTFLVRIRQQKEATA